jgi:CDP-glucose 4,6-dehydratase
MKLNILITGGFGLLGSNLYNFLDKKYNVYILDKKKNFFKKNYSNIKKNKIFLGDYLNKNYIKNILKKNNINVIFHTGAVTQVLGALDNPEYTYQNNINGTINFLEIIREINKKIVFVYSSSDKAYGEVGKKSYKEDTPFRSIFPYDVSKSCADLICQSYSKTYGLKIGILRCGNLYGPGDFNQNRLIPECILSYLKNKNFNIRSNGRLVRDYLFIEDAVKAYYLVMKSLLKNKSNFLKIYNVGSKYNLDVISLVKKIGEFFPKKEIRINVKNSSIKEIYFQKLDYKKISKDLNWKPKTNLSEGLAKTIKWYKKHKNSFSVI